MGTQVLTLWFDTNADADWFWTCLTTRGIACHYVHAHILQLPY